MAHDVLINVGAAETRVAVIADGLLQEFYLERTISPHEAAVTRGRGGHSLLGNIILGRVQRVLPGMQAAFVEIGLAKAGFLGAKEARCLADLIGFEELPLPCITACVREGQAVLVQVVKDPIGDKGARLSANVTLPGRLLVFVPHQHGIAMSRRIEEGPERERLAAIMERVVARLDKEGVRGAGFIVRTAALGRSEEELVEDALALAGQWLKVETGRARSTPPATLYFDLGPINRVLRDIVDAETLRVRIDCAAAAAEARAYAARVMPELQDRIETASPTLFDEHGIDAQLEQLLRARVPLKCGGWITIETTEALTAIDVNSGSLTDTTGLEETSVRTNLDAAAEIGRQLRLRAIGGLVVIDFIHLADPVNIANVLQTLAMSLGSDRVPTQISPMSEFGLVALTRKRVREPLMKFLTEPAEPPVIGGRIKTPETVANEVLRRLEQEARARPGRNLIAHAAPEVIAWIKDAEEDVRKALARRGVARFGLEAQAAWPRTRFEVAAQ
ncbi:MAG: Rne/Rng family ribonuclease [Alphaproteobacteria bacterium]|nr:Rne/Rng family ribonuclease [Alphaproteobacteria bacterium]